jgi:hypothetical protein
MSADNGAVYRQAGAPIEERVDDLLRRMTVEEKVRQMGAVFPTSWDDAFLEQVARVCGRETFVRGIRQCLSPTINIARDPRCGRTEETYGEDAYLTARLGVAFVKGVQSQGVAATVKHFAANFVGDGGRDSHEVHFSERILREIYFPALAALRLRGPARRAAAVPVRARAVLHDLPLRPPADRAGRIRGDGRRPFRGGRQGPVSRETVGRGIQSGRKLRDTPKARESACLSPYGPAGSAA